MPNAAELPTEIRLMIYEALFEDATQQYFPHPMLWLSDEISDECAPSLFRHLRLCISNPPQLGLHGDQWVATFSSRNREDSSVVRAIPWERIHKAKCLSNWLPHLRQVHIQYIGYQGPKMFLASLELDFDDARSSSIEFSANMHPALRTLYLRTLKTAISNAESCSMELLVKLINVLPSRESRSATRKRRQVARACRAEIWERCKRQIEQEDRAKRREQRQQRVRD
ncbi:hypothetical protein KCU85_g1835, partial [Aureobasidium melanogenum]